MSELRTRTPLLEILTEHIRARGRITFAEYMEMCLYHPEHGYYSRTESRRFADYYTSPDVHPFFGRALARQLAEMWERMDRPARFDAVECGAGNGRLAAHILDFAVRALPEFSAALHYTTVERSAARRAGQQTALTRHITAGRCTIAEELPQHIPAGCICSNEFLDALPVHRVLQERDCLREIFVGLDGEELRERVGDISSPRIAEYFRSLQGSLLEGQQAEAGLAAADWMERAGRALQRGFVLSVDYGHEAQELLNERHMRGTLLAYSRHRAGEDFFTQPGEQDLTAHVNFSALEIAGRRAGLDRCGLTSQSGFLLAWGKTNEFADLYDDGQSETERLRARLLLKTLIFPEGMGETFFVHVMQKGVNDTALTGLQEV